MRKMERRSLRALLPLTRARIQLRVAMRHGEAPTMPMMRTEMAKMTMARKGRF